MSIKKESNKTYTVFYTKKDVVSGENKRTSKRGFITLKEAKEFERSLSRESSDVTFITLFEECNANIEQDKDTLTNKRNCITKYIPSIKTMPYGSITKPYLLQLRGEIAKLDLSPKTKNKIIGIIKQTTNYANKIYDLDDVGRVLDRFKSTKANNYDIWSPEEYFKFEDAIRNKYDDLVPFFHLLFFSGLRKGEARALQIQDINFEKKTVTINKTVRKSAKSLKNTTKTDAGMRTIMLDDRTLEMLKPLTEENEKWLFGSYKPASRERIENALKYGIEVSGNKPIRIHDFRHSHISYLIMNGANIVAVSKRAGHASINVTLNTYSHLLNDSEEKLINLLDVIKM